jgi:hypothetical protein
VQQLEARPPPPPPLPHGLHQPPPVIPRIGLNAIPSRGSHSPASSSKPTLGEPIDTRLLGPHPYQPVIGIPLEPNSTVMIDPNHQSHVSRHPPTPKMDFPKFSGDNPRLWKDRCEVYFEVYSISDMLKTRFASLNFEGPAATWLQSAELRGRFQSWPAMYEAVFSHFDRDQYPLTMKQLDALKQSGSVQEYFIQF